MSHATSEHELMILLEARERLPALAHHLSAGTRTLSPQECDRLSGWYASLREDAGWPIIAAALPTPAAWPRTWELARSAGFSARTEHHNAIFFSEVVLAAVERDDLSLATYAWPQALESWAAADTSWLHDYLQSCMPAASAEAIARTRHQALRPLFEAVSTRLHAALRLDRHAEPPDRRGLRFGQQAREVCDAIFSDADTPLASGARELASTLSQNLESALIETLHATVKALNLTTVEAETVVELFEAIDHRARQLSQSRRSDNAALRAGLNIIWEFRRLERDENLEALERILPALRPFVARLAALPLSEHVEIAGPLADFYTFEAEIAFALNTREELLRRALHTCQGHRNASRLLSYLMLERANRDLLKVTATPEFGAALGPVRRRVSDALTRAADAIAEAHQLYPANELLDDYRRDLDEERLRFNLPEIDHE